MGILYNRFTFEPSLLPYTNQNKIVTYATTENFDASSTTWGEGSAPLVKDSGGWGVKNDGSITFSSSGVLTLHPVSVHNTSVLENDASGYGFTIYEVLYIDGFDKDQQYYDDQNCNTHVYRGSHSIGYINEELFVPTYTSQNLYYYKHDVASSLLSTYCNLPTFNKLHITVAAYEDSLELWQEQHAFYRTNVFLRCNNATYSYTSDLHLHPMGKEIQSIKFNGKVNGDRHYRFIAIVAGKESSTVIANNVAYLKNYFNVEY